MKVLVTGGCGFLGSHVCEFYRERGDRVISYDNMTKYELERVGYGAEAARNYNWNYLDKLGVTLVKQDIRDLDSLMQHAEGVDFIIHTAAQPAMTIAIENPEIDFSNNVRGTFNVLQVARKLNIPVVSCGTIHIYGNKINETLSEQKTRYTREPAAIAETHPIVEGTLTPLHASKRAAELYVETFIHSYGLRAASFRLTGLYGSRQFGGEDHGWVANFSIRALMERPLSIFGTGKQVRDIIYPTDVARAFHAFYEHGEPGIYNIGGGPEYAISLLECIDLVGEILGKQPKINFEDSRLGDLLYFICDISKAKEKLKWQPEIPPSKGIKMLLEWIETEKDLFIGDIK
jgi:CDP-paratose 2-epimerase